MLDLEGEADAAGEHGEDGVERRYGLGRPGVVADHELPTPPAHVELHEVGALLDRELERFDRVFRGIPASASVGDDERGHPSRRRMSGTSTAGTISSAFASRSGASVPST